MISAAPRSLRRASRTGQSGPARRSRPRRRPCTLPLSAPLRPVEKISGTSTTCSSVSPSGIGARFARASGTSRYSAHAPSMVLPKRQPPSGPPHCECAAVQAVEALSARRDGADDDALTDVILGLEPLAERVDDADRLVSEDRPSRTGYSPLTMCTSVPQMVVVVDCGSRPVPLADAAWAAPR